MLRLGADLTIRVEANEIEATAISQCFATPRTIVSNTEPRIRDSATASASLCRKLPFIAKPQTLPASIILREVLRAGRIGRSPGEGSFGAARVQSSDAELREPPLARSSIWKDDSPVSKRGNVSGESFTLRDSLGERGIFVSVRDVVRFHDPDLLR